MHLALGPGLLERAYEVCLASEMLKRGLALERQVRLPLVYEGEQLEMGYRIDMLVEGEIIVEVKAVAAVTDLHRAQLLSYLRLGKRRYGLLLNFNVPHMRDGIIRVANGW